MKLTGVTVKNFRSYVVGQGEKAPRLPIGDGLNLLVGPNNCGKSNLLRAIALALDIKERRTGDGFDPDADRPAQLTWAYPTIELTFKCHLRNSVEKTLLRLAADYEHSANPKAAYADEGIIKFRVSYTGSGRDQVLIARGAGSRRGDPKKLAHALMQLRKCVRFIYLRSGESLGNFLKGAFRELLHTVIRDHLKEHEKRANERREEYIDGVTKELLHPLEKHTLKQLREVMSELTKLSIVPHVPRLSDTLSAADFVLSDTAETALLNKGTGVRGALLVSLLSYFAQNSRRSLILAVEEPESFLHPRAQHELRADLADLAKRDDVTLLVTTHSPFMLDQSPTTLLTPFLKGGDGRTLMGQQVRGDESHIEVASNLFGESLTPSVLEAVDPLRTGAKAVVFVEGPTDKLYLEMTARLCGEDALLDDLDIRCCTGADKAALQALLLKNMVPANFPIGVLFDWDDVGKRAREWLTSRYHWRGNLAWTYRDWRSDVDASIAVEAEDMFPLELMEQFFAEAGDSVMSEKTRFKDGTFHYGLTQEGKSLFVSFLEANLKKSHCERWMKVLRDIRKRLGLETSTALPPSAPTR